MTTLEDLRQQLDPKCSDSSNLQHMLHMFEGYRAAIKSDTECPYSPGSARAYSWTEGQKAAVRDKTNDKEMATLGVDAANTQTNL